MRKTFCAWVLLLALCGSAFAGDITNPPIAPAGQTTDDSTLAEASAPAADITPWDGAGDFAAFARSVIDSVLALL